MYNLQRLSYHLWQGEWVTYYRASDLWKAVYQQQYREYTLGKPTRLS
jgi:hypothetical protein